MATRSRVLRSVAAAVAAGLMIVGMAAFTTWGFSPETWEPENRAAFAYVLVCCSGFSALLAWKSKL